MTKIQFLLALGNGLSGLPNADVKERITFYSEMIEDRMEEGLSEEDAVAAVGSVEKIVEQVVGEKIAPKRRMRVWEIVLLCVGAPIWLSLLIALFAVVLALTVALWSVIGSLWASFSALVVSVPGLIACGIVFVCLGHEISGIALIGAGLVCAGLSIFFFIGCKAATKGAVWLTRVAVHGIKRCFARKEHV